MNVYPKHPTADDTYFIDGAWAPAAITARDKRFTEAELAAEVWHSIVRFHALAPSPAATEEASRNMIIERFANHPHHDQETA